MPARLPDTAPAASVGAGDAPDLAGLRVLIVHDWIVSWAGSERVVEQMLLLLPGAELRVGVMGDDARGLNAVTAGARETWLARLPFARRHHRWYLPLYPAAFASLDTRGYDVVISSAHAFAKAVRPHRGTPHLCYCHTPPRYLWDLERSYRDGAGLAGVLLGAAAPLLRAVDRATARHVDRFVANSGYIAERVRRAYGRHAAVVYPPVSAKPAARRSTERSDSLLVLGRLVPYKRVDLAILAANALGRRLIVAGDGPERRNLERLAGPSVTFVGQPSETEAGRLMEHCRMMLFCAEEDFGITPVEANAHGMPVVAYGRGGVLESLRPGVTAEFFDEPSVNALASAIERAEGRSWDETAIRANADRFSPARFRRELGNELRQLLGGPAI